MFSECESVPRIVRPVKGSNCPSIIIVGSSNPIVNGPVGQSARNNVCVQLLALFLPTPIGSNFQLAPMVALLSKKSLQQSTGCRHDRITETAWRYKWLWVGLVPCVAQRLVAKGALNSLQRIQKRPPTQGTGFAGTPLWTFPAEKTPARHGKKPFFFPSIKGRIPIVSEYDCGM